MQQQRLPELSDLTVRLLKPTEWCLSRVSCPSILPRARCLLEAILNEAGCTFDNVVKSTCYLADMSYFGEMNAVYAKYFTGDCPARAAFAVKELPKKALVEIEMIAAK